MQDQNIKSQIKKASLISFVTRYFRIFVQMILSVILARLLTPNEYGVVAIVTVFIVFFQQLSEAGLGSAVVQHKELTKKELNGLFVLTIIIGIVLSLVFCYFSYFIKYFYSNQEYLMIGRWLSLVIVFTTITTIPLGLMRRNKQFMRIGVIDIAVSLISGVLAVVLAYKGFSYYALIYRSILDAFLMFVFYFFYSPIKLGFDVAWSGIKKVYHFSIYQYFTQILTYFGRNADNLLIGKYLGAYSLGIYDKAYELMLYPLRNVTGLVSGIMHPIMVDYKHNKERVCEVYLKFFRLLTIIGVPISILFLFASQEIVLILFGQQWAAVIPVFQIFSVSIWLQMLISSAGSVFQTMNYTKHLFYINMASNLLTILAIIIGMHYGLNAVALGIVLVVFLMLFPVFFWVFNRIFDYGFLKFFIYINRSIVLGGILFIVFIVLKNSFSLNIYMGLLEKSLLLSLVTGLYYYFSGEYKFIKTMVR